MNQHWTGEVAIGEFCVTGSGGTPDRSKSEYFGGDIPWVKSGELREGVIVETEESISSEGLARSAAKVVPAGALLLAMYGATVGRLAVLGIDAATNQAICNIRPAPDRCDTRYLFHALRAKVPELIGMASGGAQPNISQDKIRKTRVRLPPLDEQRRIAAILDKADALRQKRKRAINLLESLTQSIFLEMFGGKLELLPRENLGSLTIDAKIGLVRSSSEFGLQFSTPYVRMDAIGRDGSLDLSGVQNTEVSPRELTTYELTPGDVLFNTRNSRELVGKNAVFRGPAGMVYNNNILRMRFSPALVPEYLVAFLQNSIGKSALDERKSGTTSVYAIYQKSIEQLAIPLPPRSDQIEFAARIMNRDQVLKAQGQGLAELNALFSSLQHRAFSGQL